MNILKNGKLFDTKCKSNQDFRERLGKSIAFENDGAKDLLKRDIFVDLFILKKL